MFFSKNKFSLSNIDSLITFVLVVLMMAIPLVFTSYTRSVFEVNKMMALRIGILITYALWFIRYRLQVDNNLLETGPNVYQNKFFSWRKMGLEIPIILWCITNFITYFLSEDIRLSTIGSYDRWEGIILVINYVMLLVMIAKLIRTPRQFFWVSGSALFATFLSSLYGVFQSLGFDYMNWSVDATFRVFACINNPVHFCAYMAMVLPLSVAFLFFVNKRKSSGSLSILTPGQKFFYFSLLPLSLLSYSIWSGDTLFGVSYFQACLFISLAFFSYYTLMIHGSTVSLRNRLMLHAIFPSVLLLGLLFEVFDFSRASWIFVLMPALIFFIFSSLPSYRNVLLKTLFICPLFIFYAQLASFSRATFVGFSLAMPLFYFFLLDLYDTSTFRRFLLDILVTVAVIGIFLLTFTFKAHMSSPLLAGVLFSLFFIFSLLWFAFHNETERKGSFYLQFLFPGLLAVGLFLFLFFGISAFVPASFSFFAQALCICCFVLLLQRFSAIAPIFLRLSLIASFSLVQFASVSLSDAFVYFSLVTLLILVSYNAFKTKFDAWAFSFLLFLGIVSMIPTAPVLLSDIRHLSSLSFPYFSIGLLCVFACLFLIYSFSISFEYSKHKSHRLYCLIFALIFSTFAYSSYFYFSSQSVSTLDEDTLAVATNIKEKTGAYDVEDNKIDKNARVSMWRSSIPWIRDYIFFGSGQDTIKFVYPKYREPIYGILEGGHHLTPDRLHNEYLNTLATRGVVGFVIFYGALILTWLYLSFKQIYTYRRSPFMLFLMACVCGALVYLGQVVFNFGVVATLFLFYVLMGLSIALGTFESFHKENL